MTETVERRRQRASTPEAEAANSAVTVPGLTAGGDATDDLAPRLGREFLGALMHGALMHGALMPGAMIGVAMAALVIVGSRTFAIDRAPLLAGTVALSLVLVTALTSTVGGAIPAALDRVGLDPATANGIFITTANDVFGVLAFFHVASLRDLQPVGSNGGDIGWIAPDAVRYAITTGAFRKHSVNWRTLKAGRAGGPTSHRHAWIAPTPQASAASRTASE